MPLKADRRGRGCLLSAAGGVRPPESEGKGRVGEGQPVPSQMRQSPEWEESCPCPLWLPASATSRRYQ